jgi:isochorismate pyruvate lyase
MKEPKKQPLECTSITDVRCEIDRIDMEIIKLLSKRFEYVKEVVKFKTGDVDSIAAKERYNCVIQQRGEWANENGLNSKVIEQVYKMLLDYFIEEEMKIVKNNK